MAGWRFYGFNFWNKAGLGTALALGFSSSLWAAPSAAEKFHKQVQPVLSEYCYDCHGDGMNKGKVAFDELSDKDLTEKRELWVAVLKNVRAGLMPPAKKPRPSAEEIKRLEDWVKFDAFGIDAKDPDPGHITIRRLNRVEYRNTIRDLMGYDFNVDEELPPDDTGYGFDTIGDVLTVSPLLLEKYMQAAEKIVAAAVPRESRMIQEKLISANGFRKKNSESDRGKKNDRYSFYDETDLQTSFNAEEAGDYRLILEVEVNGQFDFDPGRCKLTFTADGRELLQKEFGWFNNKRFPLEAQEKWQPGEHRLSLEIDPLTPVEQKKNTLDLRIISLRFEGPLDEKHWVRPKNFERFFTKTPPQSPAECRQYAREVLGRFATKAYRRPVDDRTIDRLVGLAEATYSEAGKRFEDGIAQAMVPMLASPRFLFRLEEDEAGESAAAHPYVDEYALASRLSYFLWSTMPDEELFRLAEKHELRKNLAAQMKRMLADSRSREFIENFSGQWLQTRDISGIDINARVVLARDAGQEKELERARQEFFRQRNREANDKLTPEQVAEREKLRERRRRLFRPAVELDRDLRNAFREETERYFAYVVREDRSVLELIESDYTFLNEKLAKHYGLTNLDESITGSDMRRVKLPEGSPRGGVLTHGSALIVTSNPTRTSPVKRGLFILDNILGTPTPPPPPDVPQLEQAEREFKDHEPTLREVLAVHREKTLCSSCHSRMDPLGFALENFNALGMWREKERGQDIDPSGQLITGEPFQNIQELKHVLATKHRLDFYRCLAEKLLTYALGRGLEYYDVHTMDQIVERLDRENGRFSALLMGVVESAPFQKRRNPDRPVEPPKAAPEQRVELKKP